MPVQATVKDQHQICKLLQYSVANILSSCKDANKTKHKGNMMNYTILLVFMTFTITCAKSKEVFECGGSLRRNNGILSTPNFPLMYPLPIRCQWVIQARPEEVIVLYFTQYYMRGGVKASEYSHYSSAVKLGVGRADFGIISSDMEPTYLISNKPVLVVDLFVKDGSNLHMRVMESLLDVHGFNITYEMVEKNSSKVRNDSCLYHHCSFNGICYASWNFESYYCECFRSYFGSECQYDRDCGPDEVKSCQNGGTCRYYIGSTVRTCECTDGFNGARCESKTTDVIPTLRTIERECDSQHLMAISNYYTYYPKNGMCLNEGIKKIKLSVKFEMRDNVYPTQTDLERDVEDKFETAIMEAMPGIINFTATYTNTSGFVETEAFAEHLKRDISEILLLEKLDTCYSQYFLFVADSVHLEVIPTLSIQRLESSERLPMPEGFTLVLACIVQGPPSLKASWYKGGAPIEFHVPHRRMWSMTLPKNSEEQYTSLMGIDSTHVLDTGVFSCSVRDGNQVENVTIPVVIRPVPLPNVSPMAATLRQADSLDISCLSKEDIYRNFHYSWLRNGRSLNPGADIEMVEDLFPAGSRIVVDAIQESAVYTCILSSSLGVTRSNSIISVLGTESEVDPCPREEFWNVKWSMTAPGTKDIKECPQGYAVGLATRSCKQSNGNVAVWEDPDYSSCLTGGIQKLKKIFDNLKLGYQLRSVNFLLKRLFTYLSSILHKMRPTEGNQIIELLHEASELNPFVINPEETWRVILDIASLVLQAKLVRHPKILTKLHGVILNNSVVFGRLVIRNESSFRKYHKTSTLGVDVHYLQLDDTQSWSYPTPTSDDVEDEEPWLTDSARIYSNIKGNVSVLLAAIFYRHDSLTGFRILHNGNTGEVEEKEEEEEEYVSDVKVVAGVTSINAVGQTQLPADGVLLKMTFHHIEDNTTENSGLSTSCALVDFLKRTIIPSHSTCRVISSSPNYTECECKGMNSYTLLKLANNTQFPGTQSSVQVVAIASSTYCLASVLVTLIRLIYVFQKSLNRVEIVKINVCISLTAFQSLILVNLSIPQYKFYSEVSSIVYVACVIAALTFQTFFVVSLFLEIKNVWPGFHPCFITMIIGWGFPALTVGGTRLLRPIYKSSFDNVWLMPLHTPECFIFIVAIVFLVVVYIIFTTIIFTNNARENSVNCHPQTQLFWRRTLRHLYTSAGIILSVVCLSATALIMSNVDDDYAEYAFCFGSLMTSLFVPLCYVIFEEKSK